MIIAGERSSFAALAARLFAGVCAMTLAPAAAQQQVQATPPVPRAAPAKPKAPAKKPEPSTPGGGSQDLKPAKKPAGAPGSAAKPRTPAPSPSPPATTAPGADVPAQPRALPPLPPLDTSVPPPMLPRASRERMRACANEWDQMKRKSTAGLPTWREFATGCLTRQSGPSEPKAPGAGTP
ncbi:MAG: hypothetical protein ACR652_20665 [Methylocystis sp.]|uniref:hypothetical protein n=1 Tax=Methylocystis sp. TaxID=1911079 RepID=UPI003DA22D18